MAAQPKMVRMPDLFARKPRAGHARIPEMKFAVSVQICTSRRDVVRYLEYMLR
jgi:hypothetical protein